MIHKKVPIYGAYKGAYQRRKIFITVIRHLQRQKSGHPRHFFPFPVQVEKLVLLTAQFLLLAVYLKWTECKSWGHICQESFWRNYRTYGFGVAYKPCVVRGRNHYGNLRIGASAGSDTNKFLAGIHVGYEHNYELRSGWTLYWQVKSDMMIKGADLLRTGIVLGVKLPIK